MAQVNVYTRSNDNSRTGANLKETILTPANVNPTNFGKLFTIKTDGQIYAQPLYVSNLAIAGGTHNVVFVASMMNTIYALDADNGATLWTQNYGSAIIPQDVEYDQNISWATRPGILSTPVIDPATNIMYFVCGSQPANGTRLFSDHLNAIDIATGSPVHGSPVTITATYSTPDLTTPLVFNPKCRINALALPWQTGMSMSPSHPTKTHPLITAGFWLIAPRPWRKQPSTQTPRPGHWAEFGTRDKRQRWIPPGTFIYRPATEALGKLPTVWYRRKQLCQVVAQPGTA